LTEKGIRCYQKKLQKERRKIWKVGALGGICRYKPQKGDRPAKQFVPRHYSTKDKPARNSGHHGPYRGKDQSHQDIGQEKVSSFISGGVVFLWRTYNFLLNRKLEKQNSQGKKTTSKETRSIKPTSFLTKMWRKKMGRKRGGKGFFDIKN